VKCQPTDSRSFQALGPLIRMAMESNSWVMVSAGARPALLTSVCSILFVRS
jgi:hypothetical protein